MFLVTIKLAICLHVRKDSSKEQSDLPYLKLEGTLNFIRREDTLRLPKVIYEITDKKDTTRFGNTWEWETHVVELSGSKRVEWDQMPNHLFDQFVLNRASSELYHVFSPHFNPKTNS